MSGEWTLETLYHHLSSMFEERDRRYSQQLAAIEREFHEHIERARDETRSALMASEKAVSKAEQAMEKRLDAVNEFRAQLSDMIGTFIPRLEAEQRIGAIAEKIDDLATRIDKSEGKGIGLNIGWVYLLGAVAALGTVFTLYVALRGG